MNATPLELTLGEAVVFLRDRPYCASPAALLASVRQRVCVMQPKTEDMIRDCGRAAALDVARPVGWWVVGLTKLE